MSWLGTVCCMLGSMVLWGYYVLRAVGKNVACLVLYLEVLWLNTYVVWVILCVVVLATMC